jgi:hypothetical protein
VSAEPPIEGPFTPAERRVRELLESLQTDPPRSDRALTHAVVRTARWQENVVVPLRLVGTLADALVEGLRLLAGRGRREPSR